MRRRGLVLALWLLSMWFFSFLAPVAAQTTLGIEAGDFFSFRFITMWSSSDPGASRPSIVQAYDERAADDYLILGVEGETITLSANIIYTNGTVQNEEYTQRWYENPIAVLFIPIGLSAGDTIPHVNVVINETIYRAYPGASRLTHHYVTYGDWDQYSNVRFDTYWDKATGVTVESSISYSGASTTWKASFLLNYTDLWNVPELPHPLVLLCLFAASTLLILAAHKRLALNQHVEKS